MSIIGTRPPLISETNLYELHHRARLAIKPGITGMWQVSGRSDITDFEEVVRLDKEYIENWNIGLDIKILLKTVLVLCTYHKRCKIHLIINKIILSIGIIIKKNLKIICGPFSKFFIIYLHVVYSSYPELLLHIC